MNKEKMFYNGFSNYETFTYNAWLNSDKNLYQEILEVIKNAYKENQNNTKIVFEICSFLDGYLSDYINRNVFGYLRDLLTPSIKKINTYEIANNLLWNYTENYNNEVKTA
jgi:hypothetical protein